MSREEIQAKHREERKMGRRRRAKRILLVLLSLCVLVGLFQLIFQVREVSISGNQYYQEEELKGILVQPPYSYNSLLLYWKLKHQDMKEIPFVNSMEVDLRSPGRIHVGIYEKKIVACISCMNEYAYFDAEGTVLKTWYTLEEGIPYITGLPVGEITLYEPLDVENQDVFDTILNLSQLLTKYKISVDHIDFGEHKEVTLYCGKIQVNLGTQVMYDDAIAELSGILPKMGNLEGVLDMTDYQPGDSQVIFKKNQK